MDFEHARFNMIEQQVRPWEVLDLRVLDMLRAVRREDFCPPQYRNMAFADLPLPLERGQTMMRPAVEGRMLQALATRPEDTVLEIGTGSGFITACLAELGREVTSLDIDPEFIRAARPRLECPECANVRLEVADAVLAYEPGRSFDVICVTGAVHVLPERFKSWLAPGGRLFAVRGLAPAMEAVLITRVGESTFEEQSLFETDLPYLTHAAPPRQFVM